MELTKTENVRTLVLCERIDSANAAAVGEEAETLLAGTEPAVLDAAGLAYISSAGLRMILRLRKRLPDMKIVNVSPEVYEIFEMTGFTEMMTVEKAYRQMSVEGCTVIGRGAKGTVYRYNDDTVVKVYKSTEHLPEIKEARELARRAFILGIPTAISYDIVMVGDRCGSVFELIDAKSYSEMILAHPESIGDYVRDYAELLKKIHGTAVREEDMPDIKVKIRSSWLKTVCPQLDTADAEKLTRLVEATPDRMTMLHFDYHTGNLMLQNGETLLIDMDTLSHGHPVFELANIYITYVGFGVEDPAVVENFLGLPYETAKEIWRRFLPIYLGTEDRAVLSDVEKKVRLLAWVRYLHHVTRRAEPGDPHAERSAALAKGEITALLRDIDTLDF